MPWLIFFAAGILIGRNWDKAKKVLLPFAGDASARFDELYSDAARVVGTRIEDFEDRVAEKRHRSGVNGD